ncbi:OTU-domain-containing protein [Panus rudis PR-1116 ss-1]|nr:OTU-domain-containing protein [Panus rudis PR-1116 ss-1]
MAVGNIRVRHPGGVATIQIDFETATVNDLQQEITKASQIPADLQEIKGGYPPHALTVIPELPLDSLGLKPGEQLIVNSRGGSAPAQPPAAAAASSARTQAPLSSSATLNTPAANTSAPVSSSGGPDHVEVDGSYLIHRIVPDDNSCLFSSIALVFEQDQHQASKIRKIVADEIRSDFVTWSDAILGRPRDEYIATILKPTSWGGAIELSILAKYYSTEIDSVDVETGRIDKFTPPPDRDSGNRAILIYSGIHYDAATIAPMVDAPADFHQTLMPRSGEDEESDQILAAAKKLADKLRAKRAYTNTATFDLQCQVCGQGLKGEKGARAHAKDTGHTEFGEY